MARHYSRDELLKLRESPLVVKPANLPPTEEWMGPPTETSQSGGQHRNPRSNNRTKAEDGLTTDSSGNRRPAFDPRRKSTTEPEDIILGPPKTAFSSAPGRNGHRSASGTQDEDRADKNRSTIRDRSSKEGWKQDRDDAQNGDTKLPYNRRARDDPDPWCNARPRTTAPDDKDNFSRRAGDWEEGRDRDRRGNGFENRRGGPHRANMEHTNTERRNGHWRSQDGPSRAQDTSARNGENEAHPSKTRDTGKSGGFNAQDRTWGRGAQLDDEPLWMDADEPVEEKKHARTQADFEEFRAKMKAQDAKKTETPAPDPRQEDLNDISSPGPNVSTSKTKINKILDFGDFPDKFYDMLSQPSKREPGKNNALAEESRQQVMDAAAKMAKSSKFSSLFNADSTAKNAVLSQPAPDASSEDKMGFQRILKLLDQQQQPKSGERTSPFPTTKQDSHLTSPLHSPPQRQHEGMRTPPPKAMPKTKDTEFLLNLMRQPQQNLASQTQQSIRFRKEQENPAASAFLSNLAISPPQDSAAPVPSAVPPQGFFDEEPRRQIPGQDKLNPNGPPLHRGIPPGLHDLFSAPQRPSGLPPGLERRPPGFDHLPPGYGQQGQHPQQQRSMPPPPGFPPPQRILSGGGSGPGMFNSRPNAPGMAPPPGFLNMGGPPPPGFAAGIGGLGHDGPGFGAGTFDFGQGYPPPGQQRR